MDDGRASMVIRRSDEEGTAAMEDLAAPVLLAHELMSSLHLYTDRRHEMGTIVGSREVKHLVLEGCKIDNRSAESLRSAHECRSRRDSRLYHELPPLWARSLPVLAP